MNKSIFEEITSNNKYEGFKEYYIEGTAMWQESIQKPKWPGIIPDAYGGLITHGSMVAYCYYLEGNIDEAIEYAGKVASAAIDYFYGNWRNEALTDEKTIDPVWWKRFASWIDELRASLLWSTCLKQWDKVAEIAKYPTPECVEYLSIKVNPYLAYYLCLAVVVRGEKLDQYQKYVEIVERGSRQKEKLMIEVLKAIDTQDKNAFDKAFQEYLKYYKKREFPKEVFDEKVTIDGTILYNIAKHDGLSVEFPEEYIDFYVDLKRE